jgi:hypothetical protein
MGPVLSIIKELLDTKLVILTGAPDIHLPTIVDCDAVVIASAKHF